MRRYISMLGFLTHMLGRTWKHPWERLIVVMKMKCQIYEQHIIEVEHASFIPLVFAATDGMSKITSNFCRHLAEKISEKQTSYSITMRLIRCHLSFALLRAAIMCIRGSQSSSSNPILASPLDLQVAEGHLRL